MKNTVVKSHSRSTKGKKNTTVKRHARKVTKKAPKGWKKLSGEGLDPTNLSAAKKRALLKSGENLDELAYRGIKKHSREFSRVPIDEEILVKNAKKKSSPHFSKDKIRTITGKKPSAEHLATKDKMAALRAMKKKK